jgi:hypothetical protein
MAAWPCKETLFAAAQATAPQLFARWEDTPKNRLPIPVQYDIIKRVSVRGIGS